jgi:predicted CopG family antitoxin
MADKTIRVSEETWRRLRARKRGDESFDAVIERELADDDPLAGFGAWSDTTIDESVREVKAEVDDDLDAEP